MTVVSDASDLLATARETFVAELLPALPAERRYAGLMIANAMAIAARECALGAQAARRDALRLAPLASEIAPPSDPEPSDVAALRRIVSAAIRAGRFDDTAHADALTATLLATAADSLAITNPKALRP
jgi:hypothetical protein